MPLAQSYFATNLDARNEIPLAISDAFGNIQFEVTGNNLIASGSFSNLSSALNVELAGGAHAHLGNANQTGGIQFLLNTTPSDDNLSGVFEAANNIVTLTDAQRVALLSGELYINVHSLNIVSGELRGQILRDDNAFPSASNITDVDTGSRFRTSGLTITWEDAIDPNGDIVVYTLQASLNDDFNSLLVNEKLAETSFSPNRDQGRDLFRTLLREFINARRERRTANINLRVLSSDGSVSNIGDVFEQRIDFQFLRSLLFSGRTGNDRRGIEQEMIQLESMQVAQGFEVTIPNPVRNESITLNTTGQLKSNLNVAVYDVTGNRVYQNTYDDMNSDRTINISASNLASGIYIVRMTDDEGNFTSSEKVIIR